MKRSHLGGHQNVTHIDVGCLNYLHDKHNIRSMLDIGCGPGGMEEVANSLGILWLGIDGDPSVTPPILHDFTKGKVPHTIHLGTYDLGWSTEFLEHVEEKYMDNYMAAFQRCKLIVCTAAPPGKKGWHHVNCQDAAYWIRKFDEYGFSYDQEEVNNIRKSSTMKREFVRKHSMLFKQRTT